jgi:hypothetical protein
MTTSNNGWLVFFACVVYVVSIHVATKLKTADALMSLDAHLAPNWCFGGLYKKLLQGTSLAGGVLASAILAYSYLKSLRWWGIAVFLVLLYVKYAVAARRSVKALRERMPQDWKPPASSP